MPFKSFSISTFPVFQVSLRLSQHLVHVVDISFDLWYTLGTSKFEFSMWENEYQNLGM